jgi:hypothetical protein
MKEFIRSFLIVFVSLVLAFFILAFTTKALNATERKHSEAWYAKENCSGVLEFRNSDDTRTDCKIDKYSIEFDFANKWYECLTQAGHYSLLNRDQAACFLIIEQESDMTYVNRAKRLVDEWNLPVLIVVIE